MPLIIYTDKVTKDESAEHKTTEVSFLESRKITKASVPIKTRKYQPTLQGNMMSPSNQHPLKYAVKESTKEKTSK